MGSFYALFDSHFGCYSEMGRDLGNFSIFTLHMLPFALFIKSY